jgi:hypothetical protein
MIAQCVLTAFCVPVPAFLGIAFWTAPVVVMTAIFFMALFANGPQIGFIVWLVQIGISTLVLFYVCRWLAGMTERIKKTEARFVARAVLLGFTIAISALPLCFSDSIQGRQEPTTVWQLLEPMFR